MMNELVLIGRLARDVELKKTNSDKSVTDIILAVDNGKDRNADFIKVTIFGKTAEATNEYCRKGDLIGIKGKLHTNSWEDKEGKKHYETNVIADKVTFLQTKKTSSNEPQAQTSTQTQISPQTAELDPFREFGINNGTGLDEDVPF